MARGPAKNRVHCGGDVLVFVYFDGVDAGGVGTFDVAGAVTDEPGLAFVDVEFFDGAVYHVGGGFAADAGLYALVVGAVVDFSDFHALFGELGKHGIVDGGNVFMGVYAFGYSTLVGDDEEEVTGCLQAFHAFDYARIENEILRLIYIVVSFVGIDGAIPVEEYGFIVGFLFCFSFHIPVYVGGLVEVSGFLHDVVF